MIRMNCAIGFRIKTGSAVVVLVTHDENFNAMDRRVIALCDAAIPNTRQPYHVIEEIPDPAKAEKEIARLNKIVERIAKKEVAILINAYRKKYKVSAAGLAVGSLIDPQRIGNPHVRAHASEGRLFRTVVENALQSNGIRTNIFAERELYAAASKGLQKSEVALKEMVKNAGDGIKGPWRADEKAAFLAGCLALSNARSA